MFIIMVIRQKSAWSRRPLITQQRASHYGVICCLRKYGTRPDMILPGRRLTSTWWTTWGLLCCSTCSEILFYLAHLFDAAFPAELDAMLFRPMKHTADELAQCKSGVVRKLIWHPVLCVCHLIVKKNSFGEQKRNKEKKTQGEQRKLQLNFHKFSRRSNLLLFSRFGERRRILWRPLKDQRVNR